MSKIYLGIDFGTSGARAIAIDQQRAICAQVSESWGRENQSSLWQQWQQALEKLLASLPNQVKENLAAIAIDGTSATVLLCDAQGVPITEPLLYNDARGASYLTQLKTLTPPEHLVLNATSSLAKLHWWYQKQILSQAYYFLHQADWLAFLLHGQLGISDYHNALKLGYDVQNLSYPNWLESLPYRHILPRVFPPGTSIGPIKASLAKRLKISPDCLISTGTTDSIAAFLASPATQPGEAVTSLGSTLVLKLLSETYVENLSLGIYSHRLGDLWLTGGASNSGGAVLKHFFTEKQLQTLSQGINPDQPTNLDYYPLLKPGERFPVNDPYLPPRLIPRPEADQDFLYGLLTGIAKIEVQGYKALQEYGSTPLSQVYTAGRGAQNPTWQAIRARLLGVPVSVSPYSDAAYGTALLAKRSLL